MKLYTIFAVLLYVTYNHGLKLPEVDFESLSEKIVSYVNSRPEIGWKAERSKSLNVKNIARHFSERRKVRRRADITNLNTVSYQNLHIDLPETFDARENWPACSSIRNIPDEGRCDAAWAISPAATISDRICIHSNGSINVEISAFDILTCNHHCSRGCDGCDPEEAWKQWMESGVTTGGSFQSRRGCKPYPFPNVIMCIREIILLVKENTVGCPHARKNVKNLTTYPMLMIYIMDRRYISLRLMRNPFEKRFS
ncbi:unnamed protein product [Heterobilharzia americana]|nr:unnamed protein product [Heterobilharzia americana]